MTDSKGHIGNNGQSEFFVKNDEVFRAPKDSPLDIYGYRMGGRWESSVSHFSRCLALFTSQGLKIDNPERLDQTVKAIELQITLPLGS